MTAGVLPLGRADLGSQVTEQNAAAVFGLPLRDAAGKEHLFHLMQWPSPPERPATTKGSTKGDNLSPTSGR